MRQNGHVSSLEYGGKPRRQISTCTSNVSPPTIPLFSNSAHNASLDVLFSDGFPSGFMCGFSLDMRNCPTLIWVLDLCVDLAWTCVTAQPSSGCIFNVSWCIFEPGHAELSIMCGFYFSQLDLLSDFCHVWIHFETCHAHRVSVMWLSKHRLMSYRLRRCMCGFPICFVLAPSLRGYFDSTSATFHRARLKQLFPNLCHLTSGMLEDILWRHGHLSSTLTTDAERVHLSRLALLRLVHNFLFAGRSPE